jgi:hypothetical protein
MRPGHRHRHKFKPAMEAHSRSYQIISKRTDRLRVGPARLSFGSYTSTPKALQRQQYSEVYTEVHTILRKLDGLITALFQSGWDCIRNNHDVKA